MFYLQDYRECFPPHSATGYNNWYINLDSNYPMQKNIYHCPSHYEFSWSAAGISYGYNYRGLSWPPAVDWVRLTKLLNPLEVIVLADAGVDYVIAPDGYSGTNHKVSVRHSAGSNVLFADGHVAWFKFNDIDKSDWWNY
jgi:prepilin-type processing-associated H-X9-DG protein